MRFTDKIKRLRPSATLSITARAKAMRKSNIDVISFGAGEPDFDTPRTIKIAALNAMEAGLTKYTPAAGTPELRSAVCDKFRKENGLKCEPDDVVISCGAKHSLYNIFQVLCSKGDEVLIISPYWVSYPEMVSLAGGAPRFIKTDEKNAFVADPEEVKKSITKRTKALILNSPSNPAGAVYDEAAVKKIAEIAVSKKIFVISDEIYEKLIYDNEKHVSIGSLGKEMAGLTFTVNGVSKTYSMTGWRVGYAMGPKEVMNKIAALQSHSTSNPASISQAAALAALKGGYGEAEKMRKEFVKRRDYMVGRINSFSGMSCINPKGAFYIFANIAKTGLNSVKFTERLLEEAHVASVPGAPFGSDRHIRLSFATGMPVIKKGLDRIEKWLKRL